MKPSNSMSSGANRFAGRGWLSERTVAGAVCLLLAALVWLVFGQTLGHEFINFDDNTYIYENPPVENGLTVAGVRWAFTTMHASNWHPVTWISHMIDCQLYGLNAGGHHLTNVLLHAATTVALFLVLRNLTGFLWRGAFVAAVFAIHPLRVESVAWVAERKDLLSGFFFVLTIGAYAAYARRPVSIGRYALVVLMLALALLSKPMVVSLPLVLLLLDYWPLGRLHPVSDWRIWRRLVLEKVPLLALSGAVCAATVFAQQTAMSSLPLSSRLGNALVSWEIYLGQMFYPRGLAPFYPHPEGGLALWRVLAALLLLAAISAWTVVCRRSRPWLLVGWLWYLGMLVPVIGILQVGLQAHADRYTYLPQIGLAIALTWLVAEWAAGWRHRQLILGGCAAGVIMALTLCSRAQTGYWRDSESLWTRALACAPDNVTARVNLGNALLRKGRADEAIPQFEHALRIADDADAHVSLGYALIQRGRDAEAMEHFRQALQTKPDCAEARNNLGDLLAQKGRTIEAIAEFQRALQIKPDYAEAHYNLANSLIQSGRLDDAISEFQSALLARPGYPEACYNLGNTLFQKGEWDQAIQAYQRALQMKPDYANASYNLAMALTQKGRTDEAIVQFQHVLQITPGQASACYHLASALVQKGRVAEAIARFQQALEVKPDYTDAENDLAWELATAPEPALRDGGRAVALAERANQLTGGSDLDIIGTLAAACAEAGRYDDAVRHARQAIALARATGQGGQLAQLDGELKLYETGHPYHQDGR